MSYAKRLKEEIKRAGSQRKLAQEWGLSNTVISHAVAGRVFPGICERLGIAVKAPKKAKV